MAHIMLYLIQSSATLAALFSIYWIFLRNDTFFQVNRLFLVSTMILAALIPLLKVNFSINTAFSPAALFLDPVIITPAEIEKAAAGNFSWFEMAVMIYLTGCALFIVRFVFQLLQICFLILRYKISHQENARLVFIDRSFSPFSFFSLIFISHDQYLNNTLKSVIEHEKVHIRQLHSLDLILAELLVIFQWFNPFAWMLGKSLKNTHEYLADEGVLKKGFIKYEYQTLIINEAIGLQINNLTNNFKSSLLKKRIDMMTKKRSATWAAIKVGLAFPTIAIILFLFAAGRPEPLMAQQDTLKAKQAQQSDFAAKTVSDDSDPAFQVVKTMPSYPGGFDEMTKYLVSNIKYPDAAKAAGIQGAVIVTYIVEKDGSITNAKILRGIGDGCDEEALRVVKGMPKWSPGKNDAGETVRVIFNLPIKFSLESKKDTLQPVK